uniref:CD36 family protein n=1 Tax=Panagrellus redivivus TaxID=6233 RepID=A0A7E4VCZ3_PANRE
MGRLAKASCSSLSIVLGILLIVAAVVINYGVFPKLMKKLVKKEMVLDVKKNGAPNDFLYDFFNDKYTKRMQYYIFNYTNAIDIVDRGFSPDAIEVGPYSYIQNSAYDYDIKAFADSNKSYIEFIKKNVYIFDPKTSCEKCDPDNDYVWVPDPGFFGTFDKIGPFFNLIPPELLTYLTLPIYGFKAGPFVRVKVSDLLFDGYTPPIKDMLINLGGILPALEGFIPLIAGMIPDIRINQNNNTLNSSYAYRIDTGLDDASLLGNVHQMKPYLESDWWSELPTAWWGNTAPPTCNYTAEARELKGTLGDFFKTYINKDDTLSVFIDDICRAIDFTYEGTSKYNDIDTLDFIIKSDTFDNSVETNCGYCTQTMRPLYGKGAGDYCLPNGFLDLTGCLGETIVTSNPHFYLADPIVLNWFPRMKPDAVKHQTRLSIEPHTGSVLAAYKRLQLNIIAGFYPGCFPNIPTGIYPLAWVNNYYLADKGTTDDIKKSIFTPKKIVFWACVGGAILGIILMLIGSLALWKSCSTPVKRKLPPHATSSWESETASPTHLTTSSEDSGVVLKRRTRRDSSN